MSDAPPAPARRRPAAWKRAIPWLITIACFSWLYTRISAAAARHGEEVVPYLAGIFAEVSWPTWLALMVPYSALFFLIDSTVVWRVVNWFNARVPWTDVLPVRASTYILSILNEQVGKGVMAYYLNRRDGVPGWQLGSSMLFIMVCEFYYLLGWATLGWGMRAEDLPKAFDAIPWIALVAAGVFAVGYLYFRGRILPGSGLRERPLLHAFRQARLRHYLGVVALRSPALLLAVVVYKHCLALFGVEASYLQMLAYLPVVFFGAATPGPLRSVAITLWVELFPREAGELAAFGLVQHNFFIFFNAAIGLLFLRRANRELFGPGGDAVAPR